MRTHRELLEDLAIYNAGVIKSRREYRDHKFEKSCTPTHKCEQRLLAAAERALIEQRRRAA